MKKLISVVTPTFNEEDSIENCVKSLEQLFREKLPQYSFEHIVCDNDSTDKTIEILRLMAAHRPNLRVILNAGNYGVYRSIFNGLCQARGDAVIPFLPADLQDPVDVIPQFIEHWEEGFLVVYGVRSVRREHLLIRSARRAYYRLLRAVAKIDLPADTGEFQLLDRKIVEAIKSTPDHEPFLRAIIASCGTRSIGVPYEWGERRHGSSKVGWGQMLSEGLNGLISVATHPTRWFMVISLFLMATSIGWVLLDMSSRANGALGSGNLPSATLALFFLSGVQIFLISLVGEYVSAIHSQVRKGRILIERERINFDSTWERPE